MCTMWIVLHNSCTCTRCQYVESPAQFLYMYYAQVCGQSCTVPVHVLFTTLLYVDSPVHFMYMYYGECSSTCTCVRVHVHGDSGTIPVHYYVESRILPLHMYTLCILCGDS